LICLFFASAKCKQDQIKEYNGCLNIVNELQFNAETLKIRYWKMRDNDCQKIVQSLETAGMENAKLGNVGEGNSGTMRLSTIVSTQ